VTATAFLSESTTEKCVVSRLSVGSSTAPTEDVEARSGSIAERRRAAYSFESNTSRGMATIRGSPR